MFRRCVLGVCVPASALLRSHKCHSTYPIWWPAFGRYRHSYWSKANNIQRISQSEGLFIQIYMLMLFSDCISTGNSSVNLRKVKADPGKHFQHILHLYFENLWGYCNSLF